MTSLPGRAASPAAVPGARTSRDPMAWGLAVINRLAQSPRLDRLGLRPKAERAAYHATRTGLGTAAALSRTFAAATTLGAPQRLPKAPAPDLFDLTPTEDQQLLLEVVREFAAERVRPAAAGADRDCAAPDELIATAVELGMWQVAVPESLGGFSEHRSAVTGVLVAEALAGGDLGLAVAILAPAAVSTALSLWGDADQQATYLPAFTGENPPRAALAVTEPRPLFDPFTLGTTATHSGGDYVLEGVKSLVPAAGSAELFIIAAMVEDTADGKPVPALFLVESAAAGLTVRPEPAMGLRAARTGRLQLSGVRVPASARLGTPQDNPYADCIRLSRLGWCALAVGTGQAVLDYVVPYVNERVAFGEPVSHRQGVAFIVADLATELDGMRLVTYRAASRADQGLDYARETALARRLCSDHGMAIGSDGVQLLGGHGYVKEHPVERWYRDLRAVGVAEGIVLI
ncbi:MAG TPA: acyl-CoA dehydrogenase family protein [Kineosporiaceae bacterium]|nr:acyl-CoA dehydrogenase family protein [Kineosporiaceae bacterium]